MSTAHWALGQFSIRSQGMAVKLLSPSHSRHAFPTPQASMLSTSLKGCTQSSIKSYSSGSISITSCHLLNARRSASSRTGAFKTDSRTSLRSRLGERGEALRPSSRFIGGKVVRLAGEEDYLCYQVVFGLRSGGAIRSLPVLKESTAAIEASASAEVASDSEGIPNVLGGPEGVNNAPSLEEAETLLAESLEGNGAPRAPLRKKKKKSVAEILAAASGEKPPEKQAKLKKKKSKATTDGAGRKGKAGKAKQVSQGLSQGLSKQEGLESLEELSVEALLRRGWKLLELRNAKSAARYFGECVRRETEKGDAVAALLGLAEALCAQTKYGENQLCRMGSIVFGLDFGTDSLGNKRNRDTVALWDCLTSH